ncbi:MAG: hypothetical protein ACYDEA_04240, partial [Candidatus Dormibacteria bacterium]
MFVDVTEKRVAEALPPEYYLRRFLPWPGEGWLSFIDRWGALDVPEQPRDVWTTFANRQPVHLAEIDEQLNHLLQGHPEDGRTFEVSVGDRRVHVQGYALHVQKVAFRVYQAVVATVMELVLKPERQFVLHSG